MNKDVVVRVIGDFIKNGLNLDDHNTFECNLFMKELFDFINKHTHYNAHYSGKKISIESIFFDPLLSVELEKTTVHCIPVTDEGWIDAVFEVIKFIHIREEKLKEKEQKRIKRQKEDDKQFDWI
tara:strand:+ start:68 stop:439 length:372 start_codon:yes stop_codon:yes gene_type:complete